MLISSPEIVATHYWKSFLISLCVQKQVLVYRKGGSRIPICLCLRSPTKDSEFCSDGPEHIARCCPPFNCERMAWRRLSESPPPKVEASKACGPLKAVWSKDHPPPKGGHPSTSPQLIDLLVLLLLAPDLVSDDLFVCPNG